jgi:hypothetical protein
MKEISMHILDIIQNSIRAKANLIEIEIKEETKLENIYTLVIKDNGNGILPEDLKKVNDPFYTTEAKKTGLGLALLEQNTNQSGGNLKIKSEIGKGTIITAVFCHDHLDRQPLGDFALTLACLIRSNPEIDFVYLHSLNEKNFKIDTRQIKMEIGDIKISNSKIISFLIEMIRENMEELKA